MIEVLRTNNAVRLDYAVVLLNRAGCHPFVADRFMSSAEGGISAFERRIMVPDEYAVRAKEVLQDLDTLSLAEDEDPESGVEDSPA